MRFAHHDITNFLSRLLSFDGFEQRFEIAFAEALRAFALNNLEKKCRAILHRLGENLKQITFIIPIDENAQLFQCVQFFINVTDTIEQRVIVRRRHLSETQAHAAEVWLSSR